MALTSGFFGALQAASTWTLGAQPNDALTALAPQLALSMLLLAGGLWVRVAVIRPRAGHVLDVAVTLLLPALGAGMLAMKTSRDVVDAIPLLGVALQVVTRAALVPSSWQRTAVLTLVAFGPATMALTHGYASEVLVVDHPGAGRWEARGDRVLFAITTTWAFAFTVAASTVSGVMYGMRRRLAAQQERLGRYTLVHELGRGGMGTVFFARHAMLRRPTAVKVVRQPGLERLRAFEAEVQHTASLRHPNTIQVFDYGRTDGGDFYYAMELIEGPTLEALVASEGPQPASRVANVLDQVLASLGEAHARGLVHRDIKAGNVMLAPLPDDPDRIKVLDFGLVAAVGEAAGASVVGTPLYLAPERILEPHRVGPSSDLYAVGVLGYTLLTGGPPFEAESVVAVCAAHLHAPVERPSRRLQAPVEAGLEDFVLELLAKSPDERPASAVVARRRLAALRGEEPLP
ncbi:MAG: serine/threonine-protein kinase [Myxococcota bacterium]